MNIEEIKSALDTMETFLHPEDYKILVDAVNQAVRNTRTAEKDNQVSDDLVELGLAQICWVWLRPYLIYRKDIMSCPYRQCIKHRMCDECYIDNAMERRFKMERKFPNEEIPE